MSRRSELSNSHESAKECLVWLVSLGVFEKIYLSGSRSPLREKQPHEHSDWDFVGVTEIRNLTMMKPRELGMAHVDLGILNTEDIEQLHSKAVEVWPTDKYGVFDGTR